MEKLVSAIDHVSEYQGKIFSVLLVVVTVQVCYEVARRYLFGAPTTWALEFTEFLCAVMYVMGGAYASVENAHIKVDVFYSKWSPKTRALVDLFVTDLVFFFFCGVLVWQSAVWAWEAITTGITTGSMWDPPVWPLRGLLFLGSLTLFLQGVAKFIRDIYVALGKRRVV